MPKLHVATSVALTTLLAAALAGCEPPPVSGGGTGGSSAGSGGSGGSATAGRGGSSGSGTGGATGSGSGTGGAPSTGGTGGSGTGGSAGGTGGSGTGGSAGGTGGTGGSATGGAGGSGMSDAGRPERAPDTMPTTPPGDGGVGANPALDQKCTVPVTFRNEATGSAGGDAITKEFPDAVAMMQAHARTVCKILYRTPDEVKPVARQTLVIDMHDGVAYASGGEIHFSANYIGNFIRGKQPAAITLELNGVLVHESTHVWQYTNGGGWLVEAMADYVRYKSGFDRIQRRQRGGNWDSPYTTGGFFIHWIEEKYDKDFGYKVNMGMKNRNFSYPALVQQVTGKPVDTVWDEYQADI
jgi:hypothetical protein